MIATVIILSLIVAFCFAYGIVAGQIYKSNNYGDSVGGVNDFARGTWDVVERRDYKTKKKNWNSDKLFMESQARILRGN